MVVVKNSELGILPGEEALKKLSKAPNIEKRVVEDVAVVDTRTLLAKVCKTAIRGEVMTLERMRTAKVKATDPYKMQYGYRLV